mgnify:FL=1
MGSIWTWLASLDVPAKRRAVYAILAALGTLLTTWGLTTGDAGWLSIAQATLTVGALVIGSIKARRVVWSGVYLACAGLVTATAAAGYIDPATASRSLEILSQVLTMVPLVILVVRTDPSTPTGEPASEYAGRHRHVPEQIIPGTTLPDDPPQR